MSFSDVITEGRPFESSEEENWIMDESSSSAGVRWGELAGLNPKARAKQGHIREHAHANLLLDVQSTKSCRLLCDLGQRPSG
jgi:hypothetical protein